MGNPLSMGIPNSSGTLPTTPTIGVPLYTVTGTGTSGGSTYGGLAGAGGSSAGSAVTSTGSVNATSVGVRRAPSYVTALAFEYKGQPPDQVRAELQELLSHSARLSTRDNIRVDVDGQFVVLRGTVANEHDRRLAEALARLTPGVHDLRNELGVGAATAATGP
jgi:hypothetical protein